MSRKKREGHRTISVSGTAYTRFVEAATKRGVTVAKLVDSALEGDRLEGTEPEQAIDAGPVKE